MRSLNEISVALETPIGENQLARAQYFIELCAEILENWLVVNDKAPTEEEYEGFRLLALQRQASVGDPSFNACRETCREAAFAYNQIAANGEADANKIIIARLGRIAKHLNLFIIGKFENSKLGEFCCASKPIRLNEKL